MKDLEPRDLLLIEEAQKVIAKNYDAVTYNHTVGAALRCKNGNVYLGVNAYLNHGACAEMIALGAAITAGERAFDCVVAIRGEGEILPPCGNCRQMLSQYAPCCDVIVATEQGTQKIPAKELLPFAYVREA